MALDLQLSQLPASVRQGRLRKPGIIRPSTGLLQFLIAGKFKLSGAGTTTALRPLVVGFRGTNQTLPRVWHISSWLGLIKTGTADKYPALSPQPMLSGLGIQRKNLWP